MANSSRYRSEMLPFSFFEKKVALLFKLHVKNISEELVGVHILRFLFNISRKCMVGETCKILLRFIKSGNKNINKINIFNIFEIKVKF